MISNDQMIVQETVIETNNGETYKFSGLIYVENKNGLIHICDNNEGNSKQTTRFFFPIGSIKLIKTIGL